MTDMQVREQVASDGQNQSGVTTATQTTSDPVTGNQTQRSMTRMWSGRNPGVEIVWLAAGIVLAIPMIMLSVLVRIFSPWHDATQAA